MPLPRIQSLLLPVLRLVARESGCLVEEIRLGVKTEFDLTDDQITQTHSKSGQNVFVNRVAWALANLVMGKAISLKRIGWYEATELGMKILQGNPAGLTIKDLH